MEMDLKYKEHLISFLLSSHAFYALIEILGVKKF